MLPQAPGAPSGLLPEHPARKENRNHDDCDDDRDHPQDGHGCVASSDSVPQAFRAMSKESSRLLMSHGTPVGHPNEPPARVLTHEYPTPPDSLYPYGSWCEQNVDPSDTYCVRDVMYLP